VRRARVEGLNTACEQIAEEPARTPHQSIPSCSRGQNQDTVGDLQHGHRGGAYLRWILRVEPVAHDGIRRMPHQGADHAGIKKDRNSNSDEFRTSPRNSGKSSSSGQSANNAAIRVPRPGCAAVPLAGRAECLGALSPVSSDRCARSEASPPAKARAIRRSNSRSAERPITSIRRRPGPDRRLSDPVERVGAGSFVRTSCECLAEGC
jgi:hypothetical protein